MFPKYVLTFHEVYEPISSFVTKFGGQPAWYGEAQWPLSRSTGKPMRFIGQIALDARIFGEIQGRMAYLFMTDEDYYIDGTWELDGGENAVIIQPGLCDVPTKSLNTGPTLYKLAKHPVQKKQVWWYRQTMEFICIPCEHLTILTYGEDPDIIEQNLKSDEAGYMEAEAAFIASQEESKIGGTPTFVQGPEFPVGERWRLLLQLSEMGNDTFEIKFGEAGTGYAFLNEDGTRGKFLWQSL